MRNPQAEPETTRAETVTAASPSHAPSSRTSAVMILASEAGARGAPASRSQSTRPSSETR